MVPRVDECPLSQAHIKTIKFMVCNDLNTLLPDKKAKTVPNMGLPQWEVKSFIYNILLNFKVFRSKGVRCKSGTIFLFQCQYENFELERDNIAGDVLKFFKLPPTKLYETEVIGSIPKNWQSPKSNSEGSSSKIISPVLLPNGYS